MNRYLLFFLIFLITLFSGCPVRPESVEVFPEFATDNAKCIIGAHPVSRCDLMSTLTSGVFGANGTDLVRSEFATAMPFSSRARSMSNHISAVFLPSVPSKIFRAVVERVPIVMTRSHLGRARSYEGFKNKLMGISGNRLAVTTEHHLAVFQSIAWFQPTPSVSYVSLRSSARPYAPIVSSSIAGIAGNVAILNYCDRIV